MNCPDSETLIAFAMNPLAAENGDLAEHVHGCSECRMNLKLINDSLLAPEWESPSGPIDVGDVTHPLETARKRLVEVLAARGRRIAPRRGAPSINSFVHVLDRDVRDPSGAWLRRGVSVLCDPEAPGRVERATAGNMQRFAANGFSFFKRLPFGTMTALRRAQSEASQFVGAIEKNVASLRGTAVPGLNRTAWANFASRFLPSKFTMYEEVPVDGGALVGRMAEMGLLPQAEELSPVCRNAVSAANSLRVYELHGRGVCVRCFAAYVTPTSPQSLRPVPAGVDVYNSLREFAAEWSRDRERENRKSRADFTVYVMGSPGGWGDVVPALSGLEADLLCTPDCDLDCLRDFWVVRHGDFASLSPAFRGFICALYPETAESRRDRVRKFIDGGLMDGSVTALRVSSRTFLPKCEVERIFDSLQGDGRNGYENYRTEKGESASRRVSRSIKPKCRFGVYGLVAGVVLAGCLISALLLSFLGVLLWAGFHLTRAFMDKPTFVNGVALACVLYCAYDIGCYFFRGSENERNK